MKMMRAPAVWPALVAFAALGQYAPAGTPDPAADLPVPLDTPYPGVLSNLSGRPAQHPAAHFPGTRGHSRVVPGPLVLLYPKWIPGEHGPTGPLDSVVGLELTPRRPPLKWRRDLREPYAVRVAVPRQMCMTSTSPSRCSAPSKSGLFSSSVFGHPPYHRPGLQPGIVLSGRALRHPDHHPGRHHPARRLAAAPRRWKQQPGGRASGVTRFAPVSLETLIDSPLISGEYFRRVSLEEGRPGAAPRCSWTSAADQPSRTCRLSAAQLKISGNWCARRRRCSAHTTTGTTTSC